jgi:tetratricopeptide (TPR) repeat protein
MASPDLDLRAELDRLMGYVRFDSKNLDLIARAMGVAASISQFDQALELANRMLEIKPSDPQLLYQKAQLEIQAGKLAEAEHTLLSIIGTGTRAPELSAALGHVYFLKHDYGKARAPLSEAVAHPDRAPNIAPLYARTLHQLGDIDAAIAFAESWLATNREDASLLGVLSLLYVDQGNMDKAEHTARRSVELSGSSLEGLIALGTTALGKQNVEEATACFERALAQNTAAGRAWLGRGLAEMIAMNFEGAERTLKTCVELMPEHIGSWHALAWCQILRQDYAGAEDSFRRALKIDDNFGETHGGLGVLAALQGDEKKARQLIKKATRLDPGGFAGRFAQSMVLSLAGKEKDAKKIVQALIGTVDPKILASTLSRHTARRH